MHHQHALVHICRSTLLLVAATSIDYIYMVHQHRMLAFLLCYVPCRLHFVLTVGYNLWVMWVLARYFKDFVLVRQHYLSKGKCAGMLVQVGLCNLNKCQHISQNAAALLTAAAA